MRRADEKLRIRLRIGGIVRIYNGLLRREKHHLRLHGALDLVQPYILHRLAEVIRLHRVDVGVKLRYLHFCLLFKKGPLLSQQPLS